MTSAIRFIPAYAGFCKEAKTQINIDKVHPRLRGVLDYDLGAYYAEEGSSPLTRGSVVIGFILFTSIRFIPAYAGFCLFRP